MKMDLVCEGGGVKIPALAGAYEALVEKGFEASHIAGTSAGAITASVVAAGYTPQEIKTILMDTDFSKFTDGSRWLHSKLWNLAFHNGIYKGDYFYNYMKEVLAKKNIHTFKDLRYANAPNDRFAYRLKVMASDVTSQSLLELPQDIISFGINPDDLEVALAVRMSMSIPFFFRPVVIDAEDGSPAHMANPIGKKHAIVDGGVLSNFPIWTWDSTDEPSWPTFGCMLFDKGEDKPRKTTNPINLAAAMFGTMMKAHDKQFIRPDDLLNRTISIPTGTVSSIDFGISQQRKGMLYKQGYDSAMEFLKDWNWNRYKRWSINSRSRNL